MQRSLDELGTPLRSVTFCVVDLETTGTSPDHDRICEIGAVKVRGGECLGTFQTLVDPGRPIPPAVAVLTGLTTPMVTPAPRIESVLPSLQEFLGSAVLVGHNLRFDRSFLDAALRRSDRARLSNVGVDTCGLARRLIGQEVPNCRLSTLADRLRLDHRPSHRALDDALATADLLHSLLERAAGLGVTGLDDLVALPTAAAHPQAQKLAMTKGLPRSPGVYLLRDAGRRILYVGKATDLRSRVRSYFGGDTRRKVAQMLRETASIDHVATATAVEAAVLEMRLIHQHLPRYNRQGTTWHKSAYVKLTAEAFPRLSIVRRVRDDGATYLGPLPSSRVARTVADAVESAVPIRRCTSDPRRQGRPAPCAPAQLGVSTCPCAGAIDACSYEEIAAETRSALTADPGIVTGPLREKMRHLAASERFEEAADVRERLTAFVDAHRRVRSLDSLRRTGRLELEAHGRRFVLQDGRLAGVSDLDVPSLELFAGPEVSAMPGAARCADELAHPADADELGILARWVEANAADIKLVSTDAALRSPLPRLQPVRPSRRRQTSTRRGK